MFVFWYALLCTITPPVCGNVFIAAGIANTPWLPVAGNALRIGVGLFLVPLGFIANPSLLLVLESPALAFLAMAKVGAGIWLLSFVAIDLGRRPLLSLGALLGGVVLLFFYGI
jgi:TRAP-type uncharacterized transport system fused permease subunit